MGRLMNRAKWLLTLIILLLIFTTGCGQKDAEDIVGNLGKKVESLKSYKAIGTMKIEAAEQSQEYDIEIWYKQPYYYRVVLSNKMTNVTQIVLRNDDGVFVLDPSLNKSYRFKSDWPESNGAVYLYHSLAKSIIDDQDRSFSMEDKEQYLFEVQANYQNKSLSRQKIWLDQDLRPIKVDVFDPNETRLLEMSFTQFEFDVKFDADAFDMKRNLTGFDLNVLPMMAEVDSSDNFGVIEPAYIPDGVTKQSPKIVRNEEGRTVVIKYTGDFQYNLVETNPKSYMASAQENSKTDIVDLGFGIGILTEMSDMNTLTWTYDGIDFKLTGDLPVYEMVEVAKSVFGQTGK